MTIRLRNMNVGDTGRVVGFEKSFTAYRQKLLAMGLTSGTEFQVIRIAPLGDPVEIRVRDTDLSLRQDEVSALRIELSNHKTTEPKTNRLIEELTVAIIGNPNCGKTTLFNGLTGARQHVGNWAGVTVEKKTGQYQYGDKAVNVVDLPGIYSLDVHGMTTSLDEKVAREYILSREADLIINIVDTSHFEHNLYLTTQLLEMRLPVLVVLNIMDDASGHALTIDADEVAHRLGCPVIPMIATQNEAIDSLRSTINRFAEHIQSSTSPVKYPVVVQANIDQISLLIEKQLPDNRLDKQWIAIKLLENDEFAIQLVDPQIRETVEQAKHNIEQETGEESDILIADSRYGFINTLTQDTLKKTTSVVSSFSDTLDRVILNRFLGIPIFFAVMYLMFTFTIKLGRAFKPFFNDFAQTVFVDGIGHFLSIMGSPQWLITVLAGGVGNGVREVAAFIPILGFLYLFISVLEESGYMARATFVMDRFMRVLGLPGKSFVPMILGFGCNVPAMMATRTLERQRDRFLNVLLNPFMSCGARLAVFTIFAAVFFPENGGLVVFALYLIGIFFAFLTAFLMKNTLLKEEYSLFVMEIPSYHIPKLKNVLLNTWTRVKAFALRVGKIIIIMVMVLHLLSAWSTDGSFGEPDIEHSVLSVAGRALTPALAPMGIREDNWPATVAVFTGVLHKVVVVSTLKTIYAKNGSMVSKSSTQTFDFWESIKQSFMMIPLGLKKMLGFGAASTQAMDKTPFGEALQAHFDGQVGAFAYLVFVLLYFPCIATTATAYRETNLKWTLFTVGWPTGLAYLSATLFYQLATFAQHPASTTAWLGVSIVLAVAVVWVFQYWGKQRDAIAKEATLGR